MFINIPSLKPQVLTEYLSSKKFEEGVIADVICSLAVFCVNYSLQTVCAEKLVI